ncbi:LAQU0S02e10726g1_1 [Lachancea quebecensis]|uniref:LAQU0S02e10726g1_1 n=1 Tax=Lachancea quebecensis TaxID=1654605 RepID=A0A0P1KMQ6_9SACH|nr:LAQU0S02e10726g1_1 [Lachancea quebecensis]
MSSRRQKTSVACINCAKSHVTCQAERPCSRCVKKGLEATCVDAPRKRRKYLADVPDEQLPVAIKRGNVHEEQQLSNENRHIAHKPRFMSNAADLEYSILSDIIQQDTLLSKIPMDLLYSREGAKDEESQYNTPNSTSSVRSLGAQGRPPSARRTDSPVDSQRMKYATLLGPRGRQALDPEVDLFTTHFPLLPQEVSASRFRQRAHFDANVSQYYLNDKTTFPEILDQIVPKPKAVSLALDISSPDARAVQNFPDVPHSLRYATPMEIYTLISKPFSHTSGFHSLLQYLRSRFNREDIVEMCRSLAEFRPTFIAIAVTLTEEDMIFMEQCYQRTLLEYDQFISQMGTPTCVWRRNGQVSYVNDEFSLLTGWTRADLLFKMTFIVELMDDESVREYFKTFSRVAYRDFKGSERMKTCRLLTPFRGREVECCCIWTLKRDVFGLPLMIIGNFMPILG